MVHREQPNTPGCFLLVVKPLGNLFWFYLLVIFSGYMFSNGQLEITLQTGVFLIEIL